MKRTAPLLLTLALAACSAAPPPPPPAKPAPPAPAAPTSTAVPDSGGGGDKALAPLDRAKAVEGQVLDNADQQKKDIDDQSK